MDFCVLLGNLLDNAIEACMELPPEVPRKVDITLRQKEHILLYEISNPYQVKRKKVSKKKFHGYGLHNVEKCVSNNHGTFEIKKQDTTFTVTIMLNV